ncbi:MAG: hypothetical protein RMI49_02870 [Candidatus Caldarchaeum sp.]|nr:hypothetical protein [Candidatus Caldarchaeum sp.]
MSEENGEKVIELDYLETPKGPVARFEGVRQLAELIAEIAEQLENINNKIKVFQEGAKTPEGLERRLKYIEDQLIILTDDVREILNALGELSASVATIKKALKL